VMRRWRIPLATSPPANDLGSQVLCRTEELSDVQRNKIRTYVFIQSTQNRVAPRRMRRRAGILRIEPPAACQSGAPALNSPAQSVRRRARHPAPSHCGRRGGDAPHTRPLFEVNLPSRLVRAANRAAPWHPQ
jgi:hypothetical protein